MTKISDSLLAWYDRNRRDLPWRAARGERPDPYHVWLSEIMLQQTTVATVAGYFRSFLARWPTVEALAAAPLDDVLHAWQGMGYYARARNMHRCARIVAGELDGRFPEDEAELRRLPGVGSYTAAAIAAIAFERRAAVLDGNIERVMARLFAVQEALPAAKPVLRAHVDRLTPGDRPGDFAQALMDLGALVCVPREPRCLSCPIAGFCQAHAAGIAAELPRKLPKRARPVRRGVAFWALNSDGQILLRRREARGLLGGMTEVPSTPWREQDWSLEEALALAPAAADWRELPGSVVHGFTHFELQMRVLAANGIGEAGGIWCAPERLGDYALPTVIKKICRHALTHCAEAAGGSKSKV